MVAIISFVWYKLSIIICPAPIDSNVPLVQIRNMPNRNISDRNTDDLLDIFYDASITFVCYEDNFGIDANGKRRIKNKKVFYCTEEEYGIFCQDIVIPQLENDRYKYDGHNSSSIPLTLRMGTLISNDGPIHQLMFHILMTFDQTSSLDHLSYKDLQLFGVFKVSQLENNEYYTCYISKYDHFFVWLFPWQVENTALFLQPDILPSILMMLSDMNDQDVTAKFVLWHSTLQRESLHKTIELYHFVPSQSGRDYDQFSKNFSLIARKLWFVVQLAFPSAQQDNLTFRTIQTYTMHCLENREILLSPQYEISEEIS